VKVLNDREFADEWIRFFGVTTGVRLLGWAAISAIGAPEDADRRWLLVHGWGAMSTRYRNVNQLSRFREHLRAQGLSAATVEGSDAPMVWAERLVGGLTT